MEKITESNTTKSEPEWEFQESPNKVDFKRLHSELQNFPSAVYVYSYMGELKSKAPKTYECFRKYCAENKLMNYVK